MKMVQTEPKHKVPSVTAAPLTMSSREIAELCEKQHQHVRRDIANMLSELGEDASNFGRTYLDQSNRQQEEFALPKDLTLTLVTGYSVQLRKRIIDRWLELEGPGAYQIPRTLGDALQLAADQAREIDELRDTAVAHERLTAASGALCVTDAAKALGIAPKTLFTWLSSHHWTYRRDGGAWVGYAEKCAAGLLEHRVFKHLRTDGREVVRTQVVVTSKGLSRLAQLIAPTAAVLK